MTALIDRLSAEELRAMCDRAWISAAKAWNEYHAAVRRDDPLELTNILCTNAWESELYWRHLYDAARRHETAP